MAITTAEWLFKIPVTWVVPTYSTLSPHQTKVEGMMLPDDAEIQKAMMATDTTYTIPTAAMAELYAEKHMALAIADPKQAYRVYEMIMLHLANWQRLLAKPAFEQKDCPIEGLSEFNELAKALFTPANRHYYALRHRNKTAEGINGLLGMPQTKTISTATFNGSIFIDIKNRHNALKAGKFNFWER